MVLIFLRFIGHFLIIRDSSFSMSASISSLVIKDFDFGVSPLENPSQFGLLAISDTLLCNTLPNVVLVDRFAIQC